MVRTGCGRFSGVRLAVEDLPTALTTQVIKVDAADVSRSVKVAAMGAGPGWYGRQRFRSAAHHQACCIVADQDVTLFNALTDAPSPGAETGDICPSFLELIPSRSSEQVKPIGHSRSTPLRVNNEL